MNTILRVSGLTKSFGELSVFDGVSFELREGETIVLLGTNGAGKSTLLNTLLGLEKPTRGTVEFLGSELRGSCESVLQSVGYVPDHPDAFQWMTALDLFKFLKPAYASWSDERAMRYADALRFPLKTSLGTLSRGEAAKVMLAAALAHSPKLVILDEAFARLSPPVRADVLEFFVREAPLEGGAAIVATHDLDVAARLADRVLMLQNGKLSEVDDLQDPQGGSVPGRLRSLYTNSTEGAIAG